MGHDFEAISRQVIGAAIDVHKELGAGFVEPIYQKAMEVALRHRGISFERQKEIRIFFEGEEVGIQRLDLIASGVAILELKAVSDLAGIHFAQLKSYLKATGLHVGLLFNFNAPVLVVKRVVL